MNELERGQYVNDVAGLDQLRQQALHKNDRATALKVARQFEGIFMQMMFKSMRDANAVFEQDDPFSSQYTRFYRDMSDQQLTQDLSSSGALGLAEIMVDQLFPQTNSKVTPASMLRDADPMQRKSVAGHADKQEAAAQDHPTSSAETDDDAIASLPFTDPGKRVTDQGRFHSHQDFIDAMMPLARQASAALGVAPEALVAQAALETGWGNSVVQRADGSSSFNLFNIKADQRWQGDSATVTTTEFEQGQSVRKPAAFRTYDSFADSVRDYIDFVKKSDRYSSAVAESSNPERYLQELHQAGYATDPDYADKVISIMHKIKDLVAR